MRCKMNLRRALKLRTTKHCAYLERKRRWKQKPIASTMRWVLGFEGEDDGVDSDAFDSDLADDTDFEEAEGVVGEEPEDSEEFDE